MRRERRRGHLHERRRSPTRPPARRARRILEQQKKRSAIRHISRLPLTKYILTTSEARAPRGRGQQSNEPINQPTTYQTSERDAASRPDVQSDATVGAYARSATPRPNQLASQPASQPMNLESWQFVAVHRTYGTVCSRRVRDALRWPGADLITYARRGAKRDAAVRPSIERIGNSTQGKEANCRARFLIGRDWPGAISGAKRRTHKKKGCRSFVGSFVIL